MPRISYADVEQLRDPELLAILDRAAREGTPRPESQAVRAHVPAVLRSFSDNWQQAFRTGVTDHSIKELCRSYVARSVECEYCGSQRSTAGNVTERQWDDVLEFERSDRFDAREKAALRFASALAWEPEAVDWADIREHFGDEQIVELGYFVALTFGQQRWIKTLALGHREFMHRGSAGLARGEAAP